MMNDHRRIVITGARGFIGSKLSSALKEKGYDVWGIGRSGDPHNQVIKADMLDIREMEKAFSLIPPFSTVIHTAALAHGQRPPSGLTCLSVNTQITDNLLQMLRNRNIRLIFLSSVAVYGEDMRKGPIVVTDDVRPSSEYGRSKLLNERSIMSSALAHCDILRLAPVFDKNHLADVKKRVYLPAFPFVKVRLSPSPEHSFCHVGTATQFISHLLSTPPQGKRIFTVADPSPYSQSDLVTWFPGPSIALPVALTKPLYGLAGLFPGNRGYAVRCMYRKLFGSNVYIPGEYSGGLKESVGQAP